MKKDLKTLSNFKNLLTPNVVVTLKLFKYDFIRK